MNNRQFAAVICEYNPFHYGHLYQLTRIRKNGFLPVCILGGNLTQRGGISVADKYLRAECALRAGACLVLELPLPYCCSSARDFASAGVSIASRVGADFLAFGAESDAEEIDLLFSACNQAKKQLRESNLVTFEKKLSFPRALMQELEKILGTKKANQLTSPNNILAMEYLRALSEQKKTAPLPLPRDLTLESSTSIRSLQSREEILAHLPDVSVEVLAANEDFPIDSKKLDLFILGTLRKGADPTGIYGVTEDLFSKISKNSFSCTDVEELVFACADKKYTHARVRRAIMALVFGFLHSDVTSPPPYTAVLAADGDGRELLARARKDSKIHIVTKPALAMREESETKRLLSLSLTTERILNLCRSTKPKDPATAGPCIIDKRRP